MIEQVLNEILAAEAEADNLISEAHNRATEISLHTGEKLISEAESRAADLKKIVSEIMKDSESDCEKKRENILASTREDGERIYSEAKKVFPSAVDFVVKYIIVGE